MFVFTWRRHARADAAEAFVLGMKAGIAPAVIYGAIASGAGTSRMFEVRGPMMVAGSCEQATMKVDVWPEGPADHHRLRARTRLSDALLTAAAQLYAGALAQGRAKEDTAAVCAVLEDMAGLEPPKRD